MPQRVYASPVSSATPPTKEETLVHADGFIQKGLPDIYAKVVDAMRKVDVVRQGCKRSLGVRTCEYHTYRIGGGLLDPNHW